MLPYYSRENHRMNSPIVWIESSAGIFGGSQIHNLTDLNIRLLYSALDVIDIVPVHFVRCRRVYKSCHRSKIEH